MSHKELLKVVVSLNLCKLDSYVKLYMFHMKSGSLSFQVSKLKLDMQILEDSKVKTL